MDVVVQHRGEQVVRRADGVHVACKVEVDVLHRDDLSPAAPGRAALDAENRAERRLPQSEDRLLPPAAQGVSQPHRRRGLPLPSGGGRNGRHQHQLAVRAVPEPLCRRQGHLGLVTAVELDLVLGQTEPGGDLRHRQGRHALGDFNIGQLFHGDFSLLYIGSTELPKKLVKFPCFENLKI